MNKCDLRVAGETVEERSMNHRRLIVIIKNDHRVH